jgi:hypothetical protein
VNPSEKNSLPFLDQIVVLFARQNIDFDDPLRTDTTSFIQFLGRFVEI